MVLKIVLLLVPLIMHAIILSAQNGSTIQIKKTNWKISVGPDSILWIGEDNNLEIHVEGASNYYIDIVGGKIKGKGSKYTVQVSEEGAAALCIYEKFPGKMKPLFTKLYQVKHIPAPVPYVCGVRADSVIDKLQMVYENSITVKDAFHKTQLQVLGFDLIFSFSGQSDTLSSADNHFTLDMKRRFYYLTPGSVLYFDNVRCAMPDGKIQRLKPFQIFVDETNKYKVGYRLISGNN